MTPSAAYRALQIVDSGELAAPLPGHGDTGTRFRTLAGLTRSDISVGRMVEAHLDADAILAEIAGARTGSGELWGVWAAEPPSHVLSAHRYGDRWQLSGTKPWCSGAVGCTHALVTARDGERRRLFAVDLAQHGVHPQSGGWQNVGMSATDTETVEFENAAAQAIGEPGDYLERAGFWHGGVGVASCWLGGAAKVADTLYDKADPDSDDILMMHLGAVDALLADGWAQLLCAADAIDKAPTDAPLAQRRAFRVRWGIEQIATAVIDRVNRALGPAPLVRSRDHAQAVADLAVYIRQSHADHDLAALGRLVAGSTPDVFGDRT
ncbi:acyl-CoA dehydrogenase [Williamsia soli]|uniref:acyl-CoA dehydrogenase n=1 Tax=Williamsia soli TaxID=364929 RepID=UPI001A9DDDB0|nr:acyl-CoA dehydrogenase [Williamsia soli]